MAPSVSIHAELQNCFQLHVFSYELDHVSPSRTEQLDQIRVLEEEMRLAWAGKPPAEIPGLQAARRLYRMTGLDPTRTRPSSEALLRRILKGQQLYAINNVVDAGNELSLRLLLPLGLYDMDRVEGDVIARKGQQGEGYEGIRKDRVNLTDRLGLFDNSGPFGSPTSDSPRTCITEASKRSLVVVYLPEDLDAEALDRVEELGSGLIPARTGARLLSSQRVG